MKFIRVVDGERVWSEGGKEVRDDFWDRFRSNWVNGDDDFDLGKRVDLRVKI